MARNARLRRSPRFSFVSRRLPNLFPLLPFALMKAILHVKLSLLRLLRREATCDEVSRSEMGARGGFFFDGVETLIATSLDEEAMLKMTHEYD